MSSSKTQVEDMEMNRPGQEQGSTEAKEFPYNSYTTKKTIAKGLLDVSLLMANAYQLRSLLTFGENHEYYYAELVLIILSLVLQVIVAVILLILGTLEVKKIEHQSWVHCLNNFATALVMAITIINVFITAFGVKIDDESAASTGAKSG